MNEGIRCNVKLKGHRIPLIVVGFRPSQSWFQIKNGTTELIDYAVSGEFEAR